MKRHEKREITKQQYENAVRKNHGYLLPEDVDKVFTDAERWGYGVYDSRVFEEDGKFYVSFWLGSTCD